MTYNVFGGTLNLAQSITPYDRQMCLVPWTKFAVLCYTLSGPSDGITYLGHYKITDWLTESY